MQVLAPLKQCCLLAARRNDSRQMLAEEQQARLQTIQNVAAGDLHDCEEKSHPMSVYLRMHYRQCWLLQYANLYALYDAIPVHEKPWHDVAMHVLRELAAWTEC
jgi:hypothetical protein